GTAPCTASAWTYTPTTAFSANGVYTVTVTQGDTAGNTGTSGAQNITVDKTSPVVSLTSVNGVARTFPYLTNATVTSVGGPCGTPTGDSTIASVTVAAGSENGAATCVAGAWSYSFVNALSVNGAYTLTATQSDAASNTGSSGAKTVTVDTTAPLVTLTTVNGSVRTFPYSTNVSVATVAGACGTASGDSATVNVAITGAATQNGTATCTASSWSDTTSPALSASRTYS